jgi:tetratricopeptide (TPR) repeat protein
MQLFLSYAHADRRQVDRLVDLLRSGGHDPWFDHELMPGQDWQSELHEAISVCDAFVYVMTPKAIASEWCQWEYQQAVKLGKPIVPIMLQQTELPESLSRYQYADLTNGITASAVARLMGGLTDIAITIPQSDIPDAPQSPSGAPPQALSRQPTRFAPLVLVAAVIVLAAAIIVMALILNDDDPQTVSPTDTPSLAASTYLSRGNDAYRTADFVLAIEHYSNAIAVNPNLKEAYHNLGLVYEAEGRRVEAIESYSDAIALDDEYASAHYNRGVSYERDEDYTAAITDYTQAIATFDDRTDPANLDLLALLGRSSASRKAADAGDLADYEDALRDASDVISRNPSFARAFAIRGDAYYAQAAYEQALDDYETHATLSANDEGVTAESHVLTRIPQLQRSVATPTP